MQLFHTKITMLRSSSTRYRHLIGMEDIIFFSNFATHLLLANLAISFTGKLAVLVLH